MANRDNEKAERDPGLEREHRRQENREWSPTARSQSSARDVYQGNRESRGFYEQSREQRLNDGMKADQRSSEIGRAGSDPIGHRGKGPKGYSRSDERILEDVCDRLSEDASLDATDIEVTFSGGEITLSGEVANREAKRRAEDIAEQCSGVRDVQNRLKYRQENAGVRA